jgi:hypothetical protein
LKKSIRFDDGKYFLMPDILVLFSTPQEYLNFIKSLAMSEIIKEFIQFLELLKENGFTKAVDFNFRFLNI